MTLNRLRRGGCLTLATAGILLSSVGCSQFPKARFARPYIRTPDDEPAAFAPDIDQKEFNSVALSGLPARVQYAFSREHPGAEVTAVHTIPSGSGPMLYRIAYMDGGVAFSSTYSAGGGGFGDPGEGTIIRPDDSGRPKATYGTTGGGSASAGIPAKGTPANGVD